MMTSLSAYQRIERDTGNLLKYIRNCVTIIHANGWKCPYITLDEKVLKVLRRTLME